MQAGGVQTFAVNSANLNGTQGEDHFVSSNSVRGGDTLSIDAYVRFKDLVGVQRIYFEGNAGFHQLVFGGDADRMSFGINATGNDLQYITSASILSIDTWYHVVAVFDKDVGKKLYVDAVEVIDDVGAYVNSVSVSTNKTWGADKFGGIDANANINLAFGGLNNIAFTPAQVAELFVSSTKTKCFEDRPDFYKNSSQGFYNFGNFDGNTGTETDDQSGSGNTITTTVITGYTDVGLEVECSS